MLNLKTKYKIEKLKKNVYAKLKCICKEFLKN